MSSMNKKSFISVKWMLTVTIIIILLMGLIIVVRTVLPVLGDTSDIQRQRSHINELITTIDDVLLTGEEQIVKFEVEEYTKCIWYNFTESNNPKLEVEYEASNESFSVPSVVWNGNVDKSDADRPDCDPNNLVGPKTCDVRITTYEVEVIC